MKIETTSRLLACLLTLTVAGTSIAQQMNYQGRLLDGAGNAVPDGQYPITFDIYSHATSTSTSSDNHKWGPQVKTADVVNGRFNVILGPEDSASSPRNIVSAFDGGTRYLQITFQNNAITPRQQILSSPTAFYAEQAGRLASVFVQNGNVGVGTENPTQKLHVEGTGVFHQIGVGMSNPSSTFQVNSTDTSKMAAIVQVNGATKLLIHPNGGASIGVNRVPPPNGLDVQGNADFGTSLGIGGGVFQLNHNSGDKSLDIQGFRDAGMNSIMRIDRLNDYVGIGPQKPASVFHVQQKFNGDTSVEGFGLRLQKAGSGDYWDIGNWQDSDLVFQHSSGGAFFYIRDTDGAAAITSDRRLKKGIQALPPIMDQVRQLKPVSFRYRPVPESEPITRGFIAQDVEAVFPDLVEEKGGYKTLAVSGLIPITVAAVQELDEKTTRDYDRLQKELAELKARLRQLEEALGLSGQVN